MSLQRIVGSAVASGWLATGQQRLPGYVILELEREIVRPGLDTYSLADLAP